MIDWLPNDILWEWERKSAHIFTTVFLGTGLRLVITMPPTRLFGGFRLPFEKWWPDRLLYATISKRVLHILRKFEGSKQRINWGLGFRTNSIFLKEKAYPNFGN